MWLIKNGILAISNTTTSTNMSPSYSSTPAAEVASCRWCLQLKKEVLAPNCLMACCSDEKEKRDLLGSNFFVQACG